MVAGSTLYPVIFAMVFHPSTDLAASSITFTPAVIKTDYGVTQTALPRLLVGSPKRLELVGLGRPGGRLGFFVLSKTSSTWSERASSWLTKRFG